ncbi:unnamed protein product [Protopolystoma xenopodis]|uniref:Uncharacterized protein n=1 Tax=Protopolystoma xenopodis TaxID=117903 RepID=A0A448WM37_9PLAT|nr:unnamed protein product [Protopolystoma xenopodis]
MHRRHTKHTIPHGLSFLPLAPRRRTEYSRLLTTVESRAQASGSPDRTWPPWVYAFSRIRQNGGFTQPKLTTDGHLVVLLGPRLKPVRFARGLFTLLTGAVVTNAHKYLHRDTQLSMCLILSCGLSPTRQPASQLADLLSTHPYSYFSIFLSTVFPPCAFAHNYIYLSTSVHI